MENEKQNFSTYHSQETSCDCISDNLISCNSVFVSSIIPSISEKSLSLEETSAILVL